MKFIYLVTSINLLPFSWGHQLEPPRQILAGISVPDTVTIRNAMALARKYNDQTIYNHVVRVWLLGSAMLQSDPLYNTTADQEVHAVAALLHDISLDPTSDTASATTRFEVDGANVARQFIRNQTDGTSWDERRVQLLWDSIALHLELQIAREKEVEVRMVNAGVVADITGDGVPAEVYQNVLEAYPMLDLFDNVQEKFIQTCKIKPVSTYDTWQQSVGEMFVPEYSAEGHRLIDIIVAGTNQTPPLIPSQPGTSASCAFNEFASYDGSGF